MRRLLAAIAIPILLAGCSPGREQTPPAVSLSRIPHTSDAHFERDVIDSEQPVLVDFYATWCAPCKRMEPVLDQVAQQYEGKAKIVRIDVEKNPQVAERYRIDAIPRLMLFRDGDLVEDMLGSTTSERLSEALDSSLASRRSSTSSTARSGKTL